MKILSAVLVSLLLTLPLSVSAQESDSDRGAWVALRGGLGTYAMSDMDDLLDLFRPSVEPATIDNASWSLVVGISAGYDFRVIRLAATYERLLAGTEVAAEGGNRVDFSLPADVFLINATYMLPTQKPVRFGFTAGGGLVVAQGSAGVLITGEPPVVGDMSGQGPALEGLLMANWSPEGSAVNFGFQGGYRYAVVSDVELNQEPLLNQDGSSFSLDYSGFVLRVDLRLPILRGD